MLVVPDPELAVSADQEICIGGMGTVSVVVSGGVGSPAYQWQVFNSGWMNIASATNPSYSTVFSTLGSFSYRVLVTQGEGCFTVSDTTTITVIPDPEVVIAASATQICTGGTVMFTSTVTGASGTPVYQWQQFVSSVWVNVGINNDTFVTPALTTGSYNYRLIFSQGSGCEDQSNTVNIQVSNDPTATIAGDNLICEGEFVVLSSTVSGGVPPYTFHWQLMQGAVWSDVGSTQPTFNTGALLAGTYAYRLFVENSTGCNVVSNTFTTTAAAHPSVTIAPATNPICAGGVASLTATVTGGQGTNTYSWQYNHPVNGWQQVNTSAGPYNTVLSNAGTYEYRLIVTQSSGCQTISGSSLVVVNPDPTVTVTANNPSICIGGSSILTSTMSGGSTHLSYQWYSGPTSTGSWTLISGATSSTYSVPSGAASSLWYRISVIDSTSGCFDPTSPAIQVSVVNDPVVTIIPIDSVNCLGDPILLTLTVSGGTGINQYDWNLYDGAGWIPVGDVEAFDPGVLPSGVYTYRVIVTQNSGCETVSSDYNFNVIDYPEGSLTSTPGSCGNNEGTITVTFTDHPLATGIQISLDGGATYFPSIPDSLETATYTGLAPNFYSVWAKWDSDDCAVFIDSIQVTELACGSICGQVTDDTGQPISNVEIRIYRDLNNNDVFDAGETLFGTVYTDGDTGDYCLEDIPAGEYVVFEVQPANYNSVSDYDHSTNAPDTDGYAGVNDPDDMIPATVLPGEPDMDNDFIEDPFLGSISGNVADDGANNLVNIVVNLYADINADGIPDGTILATRLTDASGNYLFAGVEPDDYVVTQINLPLHADVSDYDHTTSAADPDGNDTAQGPDGNIPVHVAPGEADDDNDFIDGRPGTICGTVSNDMNQPLSNVEILLFHDINNNDSIDGGDVHVATQFTDGDSGDYCFEDVMPGEYIVVEIQPAYHTSVSDYDHSTGAFDNDGYPGANDPDDQILVTLMPIEQDFDNDFIEDGLVGTISGLVSNEVGAPIFGVMISLHLDTNADGNPDGAALATALTNTTGEYFFTGVEAGFYVLVETSPMFHSAISDYDHTTTAPDTDGNDSAQGPDDNIPVRLTAGRS